MYVLDSDVDVSQTPPSGRLLFCFVLDFTRVRFWGFFGMQSMLLISADKPNRNDYLNRQNFRSVFSLFVTGHIIMVETVTVPIVDGILDSGVTRWKENVSDDNPYAYILRVYCTDAKEPYPSTHRIGLKLMDEVFMKVKISDFSRAV
jgi:hypothetical protein